MSRKPKPAAPELRQPRGVTSSAFRAETYRAGLHAELQKFGKTEQEVKQLQLFTDSRMVDAEDVEPFGLDLSVSEDKALSAIQILADRTRYEGSEPAGEVDSKAFGRTKVIRLSFTWTEYFEAYGLTRRDGRFQGKEKQEARDALLMGLTKPRRFGFATKRWIGDRKDRRQEVDIIRTRQPLVQLYEAYHGLAPEEAEQLKAGQEMPERIHRLALELSPLLVLMVDSFYLLKPVSLHREIEELAGGRRVSRAVSLFISWLLTKPQKSVQIHKDKLATRLRLDRYIQQRKRTVLEERLRECLGTAKQLAYLVDYQEDHHGTLRLELNPERCPRVRAGATEEEREDEADSREPEQRRSRQVHHGHPPGPRPGRGRPASPVGRH